MLNAISPSRSEDPPNEIQLKAPAVGRQPANGSLAFVALDLGGLSFGVVLPLEEPELLLLLLEDDPVVLVLEPAKRRQRAGRVARAFLARCQFFPAALISSREPFSCARVSARRE